ncbi:hypothetical protein BH20VER1_BH20VER1_19620 [soil metagenome]
MEEGEAEYDLAGQVIGCAMKVHTKLGHGFIESVYKNALTVELRRNDFTVEREKPTAVFYEGVNVGGFTIDMIVNEHSSSKPRQFRCS